MKSRNLTFSADHQLPGEKHWGVGCVERTTGRDKLADGILLSHHWRWGLKKWRQLHIRGSKSVMKLQIISSHILHKADSGDLKTYMNSQPLHSMSLFLQNTCSINTSSNLKKTTKMQQKHPCDSFYNHITHEFSLWLETTELQHSWKIIKTLFCAHTQSNGRWFPFTANPVQIFLT